MDEKRKRLLELVEELKFPFLIKVYENIKEYREATDTNARAADPEAYQKIQDNYTKEMSDLQSKYTDKLEKVQENEDQKLDDLDEKADRKIDDAVFGFEKDAQEVEDVSDSLVTRIKAVFSEN